MARDDGPRFSLGRSLLFSSVLVVGFFALAEASLRLVGIRERRVPPRLLVREMDTDITLPFMREDHDLFWSPQPGFRGRFRDKPVTINALGLRGPEVAIPKPPGRKRLVCFGDSITFGYAIGDSETYCARLGLRLADRGVEVVNAGVTGYTSFQVLRLLRRLAPRLDADFATILIGWNDGNKRPVTDLDYMRRLRLATAAEGALDRLYLYKALRNVYLRFALAALPSAPRTQRGPVPLYRENLRAIVAECRAHSIRPAFIALPRRRLPGETPPRPAHADALAETARELGVPLLDVGELGLDTPLASNASDFIDALHFSPQGSETMAELLARQLIALGWV